MTSARDVLNKLIWDKRFKIDNYSVIFVHRGALHDLKVVKASAIGKVEKSFFIIEEDTMIPFHRVRAIRDLKSGEDIFTREGGVPYPLGEIEGHEDLGPFKDIVHDPRPVASSRGREHKIYCGSRLSFPEDEPSSFEERAREGTKKFEMVELSFFRYDGSPEEAERYESMISFAAKVIAETRLKVGSLHLPNINILSRNRARKMIGSFLPFCTEIDCRSIVVHPGSLDVGLNSEADDDYARTSLREILQELSGELEESNVSLSVETYPGKNRVPSRTPDLNRFISDLPPVYRIAYDTSHTIGDTDSVIEEVLANLEKIAVFHFSNRCRDERHMPIFSSRGVLNFSRIVDALKASRFNGLIILEYQPKKYRMLLERDLKLLKNMINKP